MDSDSAFVHGAKYTWQMANAKQERLMLFVVIY